MRVKTFYRALRLMAAVVLFFFVWTFGPIWQAIAFAVTSQKSDAKSQTIGKPEAGKQKAAERFEGALAEIREKVGKVSEKHAKGEDASVEHAAIRAKRASIDLISEELRAEFASTEKRIKAAGLPKEILERHVAFVAHFEKNVKELHDNLDGIESAKNKDDRRAKIEKARLHLEKTRPPRHHTPLNPDQLPNRNRKATKTVAPRLKREDFERDFPQQKTQNKRRVAGSHLLPDLLASMPKQKPILLAFNGPDSDIPFSPGAQPLRSQFAFADSSPFLLAQATGQPSADDLAETPEVQFTDAIRAKAQELGGNPLKIYEWVRNNIEYAPTYGSIQGADMCLQSKICNDMDTASLLIALLRVSGVYSHYELSTIEIPIEKAMNWVGGFTDPRAGVNFIASGGIPVKSYASGGFITKIHIEHVSVEAWIDYIPSRGAVHKQGDTWIPLDPSFKQYTYKTGIDIQTKTGIDAQGFLSQITASSTIDPSTGSINNVPSADVQNQLNSMITSLNDHINTTMPNATIGDVFGGRTIIAENYKILPASLPNKVIVNGGKFAQIPDSLNQKITISIDNPDGLGQPLIYTTALPSLASKKITLSYMPATDSDAQLLTTYGHYNVRPYLVKLKPTLYIDGAVAASGDSIGMGEIQDLLVTFTLPDGSTEQVTHKIPASTFASIGLDLQRIPFAYLTERKAKLDQTLNQLGQIEVPVDDVIGEILNLHSLAYFLQLETMNRLSVQGKVAYTKQPAEMLTTLSPNIGYLYGVPYNINGLGMKVDVKRYVMTVVSLSGDTNQEKAFMLTAGHNSSAMEHAVFEEMSPDIKGVSAVKIISEALKSYIPIYEIYSQNSSTTLSRLQISSQTMDDVRNALASGKRVYIPERSIQYYDWVGDGYIIIDPATGAGAYMISGGLAGGGTAQNNSVLPFTMDTLLQAVGFTTLREAFRQIGDTTPGFSPAVETLRRWAGPVGVIISSVFAGLNMYQDADSGWHGFAAFLGTFGLGVLAWAFLGWSLPGLGLVTAIIAITAVIMLTMILRSIILDYISSTAFFEFRHRHYAHKKYLPIGAINVA